MTSPSAFYLARALTQWSLPPLPPLQAPTVYPGALPDFETALAEIRACNPALVSLDLFDTLVFRQYSTSSLQETKTARFISWQLRRRNVVPPTAVEIQQRRQIAAERLAAAAHDNGRHGEFELIDLLTQTVALCVPEGAAEIHAEIGQKACAFEIAEERACLTLIPGAIEFLNQLAEHYPLICVSDTPLPAEAVADILARLGIDGYFNAVHVSSLEKKNKRTGSLFDAIAQSRNLPPATLLHLGDNPINDLASPLARGWQARLLKHAGLERQYQDITQRVRLAEAFGSPDYLAQEPHRPTKESAAFRVGKDNFSLAFSLFALELLKLDQTHCYRKIYFVSRDGYLLRETFAALAERVRLFDGAETAGKTTYLHLNRLSTLCPSSEQDLEQAIHYATLVNGHQSGLGLFATLGFDVDKYRDMLIAEGCPADLLRSISPETLSRIYSLIREDTAVRRALLADLDSKRDLLAAYLEQHDFFGPGKVLFVDVGWRYRIAANLSSALPGRDDLPEMHCLLFGHTGEFRSPRFVAHPGFFYDTGREDPLEQLIFHHKELIESICTASHGTCLGYSREGDRIVARLASAGSPSALRDEVQAGIVAGVHEFAEIFNRHQLDTCFHLAALIKLLHPFLDRTHPGYTIIQSMPQPSGASHARPEDKKDPDASFLYGESRSYIPDKLPPIRLNLSETSPRSPATEPLERLLGLIQHLCHTKQPIVLWGMGLLGKLLYPHVKEKLLLVVDMDSGLHGKQYEDHEIANPNAIKALTQGTFIVLFTPLSRALPALLNDDISVIRISDWLHPDDSRP